jgi:hypothetical protein
MELRKAVRGAIVHIVAPGVQAVSGSPSMALFPGLPAHVKGAPSSHAELLMSEPLPVSPECRKQHATAERRNTGKLVLRTVRA